MHSVASEVLFVCCHAPSVPSTLMSVEKELTVNSIITKQKKVAKRELVLDCWLILRKR